LLQCKAEDTPGKCCSQCYEESAEEPCDDDHYCLYVDWPEYQRIQAGGVITCAFLLGIATFTVIFRDILKVWTCGGLTDPINIVAPERQLTTMSAAYAAETMPVVQPNMMN
jgi:hypothetical protein